MRRVRLLALVRHIAGVLHYFDWLFMGMGGK